MSQGNVVLLNGTSSAGKSSIAQALQAISTLEGAHANAPRLSAGRRPIRIAFCPACGHGVPPRANFCPACGRSLKEAVA